MRRTSGHRERRGKSRPLRLSRRPGAPDPKRLGAKMKFLLALLPLFVAACQSGGRLSPTSKEGVPVASDVRELNSADAREIVETRIQKNDWRFLGCYSDEPSRMTIPGLNPEEIGKYVDSGLYQIEVYFDHRAIIAMQIEGDIQPWIAAQYAYAARMNRELLKKVKERNSPNQPPLRMPGSGLLR